MLWTQPYGEHNKVGRPLWEMACQPDSGGMGWSLGARRLCIPETFSEEVQSYRPRPVGQQHLASCKSIMVKTDPVTETSAVHV